MAETKFPVKVKRGDEVREAGNVTTLNQLRWDGFQVVDDTASAKKTTTRKPRARSAPRPKTSSGGTAAGETTEGTNPS